VNYRSWDVLKDCLNSFEQFTPQLDYEIIIVDNDSQDGQIDTVSQQFPSHQFINNEGNYGFSSGCNLGSRLAQGEYLLFLNPDTLLTENHTLETLVSFARSHSDVGITSCRRISSNGKPEREMSFINPWLTIGWVRALYKLYKRQYLAKEFSANKDICYPEWVSGAVILIKSSLFRHVGEWSEDDFWMYFEDPDLCLRLKQQGKKTALLRTTQLTHVHGGSSRKTTTTTAITKSEVIISCHVYIQKHTLGINRICLHSVIVMNTVIGQIIKIALSALLLKKKKLAMNIYLWHGLMAYYKHSLKTTSWKSRRLRYHGA
jgi:GT2 family glycosyltransferase